MKKTVTPQKLNPYKIKNPNVVVVLCHPRPLRLKFTTLLMTIWQLILMEAYRDWVWIYILLLLGTIHILRTHFYGTKLNLTSKFFTKSGFFRQNKRISILTLHFDKNFVL